MIIYRIETAPGFKTSSLASLQNISGVISFEAHDAVLEYRDGTRGLVRLKIEAFQESYIDDVLDNEDGVIEFEKETIPSVTIEHVREIGKNDAITAISESGDKTAPDGGWDGWLVDSIGDKVFELFGEDPEESRDGWSDAMAKKLSAYHEAACEAAENAE